MVKTRIEGKGQREQRNLWKAVAKAESGQSHLLSAPQKMSQSLRKEEFHNSNFFECVGHC